MSPIYDTFDVPVAGGDLRVGRWRGGVANGPTVLAAHGVTANHLAWAWVAEQSPYEMVAPDLRGRGRSAALAGPAGMKAHCADLLAVLDHLELERAILLGHSMGGFVAATFAAEHPERTASVLLVDGGLPLPAAPADLGPDEVLAAAIGPAAQRLQMTFPGTRAYLDFWRDHPALASSWSPGIEAYLAYDLVGVAPDCRSSVSVAAVHDDSLDIVDRASVAARVGALPAGTMFLRAVDGMLGEPGGMYPADLARAHRASWPELRFRDVDCVNHYTVLMADHGAGIVAAALGEG